MDITSLNVSRTLTFALQPELGDELQINGAITMTAYIRSSAAMQGNLEFTMSERTHLETEIPVSGANIESPIVSRSPNPGLYNRNRNNYLSLSKRLFNSSKCSRGTNNVRDTILDL